MHTFKQDAAIASMVFSPKGDTIASFSEESRLQVFVNLPYSFQY